VENFITEQGPLQYETPEPVRGTALRAMVICMAVIATLFAVFCAISIVFLLLHYNYESSRTVGFAAEAAAFDLASVLAKVLLGSSLISASSKLWRYAAAIKRSPGGDDAILLPLQVPCWRACVIAGVVFMAVELGMTVVQLLLFRAR
jgi:hypothetical protein